MAHNVLCSQLEQLRSIQTRMSFMFETIGAFVAEKIFPFTLDLWLRRSSKEEDGVGLFRALKLEINHNREIVRMCIRLDHYPKSAELASSMLETTFMDAILLNSGAHALVLKRLGALQVPQEVEEDSNEEPCDRVSADQLLIRVAGRIRAFKSIGRNAGQIPAANFQFLTRLRNISHLLTSISKALP